MYKFDKTLIVIIIIIILIICFGVFIHHALIIDTVIYHKDTRTNICFAKWNGGVIQVSCDNIPLEILR